MSYDDNILHAVDMAAARERHGVPNPCHRALYQEPCDWPGTVQVGHAWMCEEHAAEDRETDRILRATWPPLDPGERS